MNAYDFSFTALDGGELPLAAYAGKALLVVNTASFCGLTPQYAGLQALHERYRARGLIVLGVPSNDFGRQEPGTAEEIRAFCTGRFAVGFPLTAKQVVVGDAAHPFYRWAVDERGAEVAPKWNFHKYLIGRDGGIAAVFGSRTAPDAPELIEAVEAALGG